MFNLLADTLARLWLLNGWKYDVSRNLAGADWNVNVQDALVQHGLTLNNCNTLDDIANVFRGKWHWLPDPVGQAYDIVYPPVALLRRGGDDCDGWAGCHAQAVEYVLGNHGWQSVIVSYFAEDWTLSHHFALAVDPQKRMWVIQPQPRPQDPQNMQLVFGPFASVEEATRTVASWYNTKAMWWDVRTPMWQTTQVA